ncbi:hypothetical protein K503DRAFT_356496 [Rhizopogon vinicolor AM-OR11-026]|uniref:Uncharacterized protein n=1 Tax=Rhizopogon vinicolor AM-OR11-026 TaxID=1314800 RepID=A0A1B7MSV5_9AGAM|nr:hypothetical protein K503DRAFT_356496 [Rhizopogon vinicolor AM-OR11-026]
MLRVLHEANTISIPETQVIVSTSTPPVNAPTKSILTSVMTLEGHEGLVESISCFPDGKRIISGSDDKTARQWGLQTGKEFEKARGIYEHTVRAVAVSKDGRWVIAAGGDGRHGELKACEVETRIVKIFPKRVSRTGGPFIEGTQHRLSSMFLMHKANSGCSKKDDDLVPDEYFDPPSPNLDSQQPTAAAPVSTGEMIAAACASVCRLSLFPYIIL